MYSVSKLGTLNSTKNSEYKILRNLDGIETRLPINPQPCHRFCPSEGSARIIAMCCSPSQLNLRAFSPLTEMLQFTTMLRATYTTFFHYCFQFFFPFTTLSIFQNNENKKDHFPVSKKANFISYSFLTTTVTVTKFVIAIGIISTFHPTAQRMT